MGFRYSFGGDEHLHVECSEEMSLPAFFDSLFMTSAIKGAKIDGVVEICPANASFQLKFNPDVIKPNALLERVKAIEISAKSTDPTIDTRILEIPVLYDDPWTNETLMRFRERHQKPDGTDLEYAAEINGFKDKKALIAAHSATPWFVTMVGFVAGLPFLYQMVEREKQIQVPKYLSPRTDTPKLTLGYGGCFSCIYSVRGAGGYQMFGIVPTPIYDPKQEISYLKDFMVLFRPGDIVKFKPINRQEYDAIVSAVDAGEYTPTIRDVTFNLNEFRENRTAYTDALVGGLYAS